MSIDNLAYPAVVLLLATSILLLVSRNWRVSVIVLGVQYLGAFILVSIRWPLEIAGIKVLAGWMSGVVLGMAALSAPEGLLEAERFWPSRRIFRLLAASLVVVAVLSIAPTVVTWIPGIGLAQAWGGLLLIGMGLLHLGLTAQPLRVILGLLTLLAGFEILYAAVESASLVAGLLAAINLGLALVGAYLLVIPGLEDTH